MKLNKKKYYIFLLILLIIQIIRCFSNARGYRDEHYFITLGYRFATGTRMFVDDIGIAQMMGFILMPIVKLYLLIFNSTDGIVLYMRLAYVIMTLITSLLIYKRFNKESDYAGFASLIFFIFTPFSIMGMSYNSMAINFIMQSICLFDLDNKSIYKSLLSGILYSFVVICNPYMAILYLISFIYVLINRKKISKQVLANYLYSLIGIVVIAILFILFVFVKVDINEVFSSFKYLVDPTHKDTLINKTLGCLGQFKNAFNYLILIEGIISVILIIKYNEKLDMINKILCIACILYYFIFSKARLYAGGFCVILMPITLCYLYKFKDIKDIKTIYFYIILFESFCFLLSSNVGARAISNILINALVLIIIKSNDDTHNLDKIIFILCFISLMICRVLLDNGATINYERQVKSGPFKYLYCDEDYAKEYDTYLNEFNYIDNLNESDNIYITADNPWVFLNFKNKKIINFSTFQYYSNKEDYINMFKEFMSNKEYDNYYLYVVDNEYGININDLGIKATLTEELEYGDLYLVNN